TVSQLQRMCHALPREIEASTRERSVQHGPDADGTWKLTAVLPADEGALVEAALAAARSDVFRDRHPDAAEEAQPEDVSWADALGRMAEIGLDATDPATKAGRNPSERYSVVVHVDSDNLARLHAGPVLPDPVRRQVTCDAKFRAVVEQNGKALGLSI